MKRAGWSLLCAALFILGCVGTPLHLAIETHDWHHHHAEEDHHDSDTDQESHPGSDHESTALAKTPRFVAPLITEAVVHVGVLPPDVRAWVPSIEPEAQSPPEVFASPPRSPRSPPV